MLELLRRWGAKQSQGMSVELVDADRQLPIAYRNTIANMMAEAEALNGIFAPDDITYAWYRAEGHHRAAVSADRAGRRRGLRDRRDARSGGRAADDRQAVQPGQRVSGRGGRARAHHVRQGDDRLVHQRQLRRSAAGGARAARGARAQGAKKVEREFAIFPGSGGVGRQIERPDPRLGGESIAEVFRSVGGEIRQSWCGPCFGQGPDALDDRASARSRRSIATGRTAWASAARATSPAPRSSRRRRSLGYMAPPSELGLEWEPEITALAACDDRLRRSAVRRSDIVVVRRRCRLAAEPGAAPAQPARPARAGHGHRPIDHDPPGHLPALGVRRPRHARHHHPRREHHRRLQRRRRSPAGPTAPTRTRYAGVGISIDGGAKVTIKNAVDPRLQGRHPRAQRRRICTSRATTSQLQLEAAALQRHREGEPGRLDVVPPEREGRVAALRRRRSTSRDCDGAEIDHNTRRAGPERPDGRRARTALKIWNNTFSFLSGIGIGLYRASDSTIMHNRIDWCVRGYSHGFYNRGQDSAGLLMYEQSSNNVVAYNSVTHGGDGLFLWAGQTTMDTGQGGANDNLFYDNDFSHAPTNGIEATFSRNAFIGNRVEECWHGVWGGYSYDSRGSRQHVRAQHRRRSRSSTARTTRSRATRSTATRRRSGCGRTRRRIRTGDIRRTATRAAATTCIGGNTFTGNKTALDSRATRRRARARRIRSTRSARRALTGDAGTSALDDAIVPSAASTDVALPTPLPGGIDADDHGRRAPRPRHDHRRRVGPVRLEVAEALARGTIRTTTPLTLRVLGPAGRVEGRVASAARRSTPSRGRVPARDRRDARAGRRRSTSTSTLEYRGGAVISPARRAHAGRAARTRSATRRFFAPIDWTIRFFDVHRRAPIR